MQKKKKKHYQQQKQKPGPAYFTKTTQDLENMDSYQYKDFKTKNGGDQVYSFNMKTNG